MCVEHGREGLRQLNIDGYVGGCVVPTFCSREREQGLRRERKAGCQRTPNADPYRRRSEPATALLYLHPLTLLADMRTAELRTIGRQAPKCSSRPPPRKRSM